MAFCGAGVRVLVLLLGQSEVGYSEVLKINFGVLFLLQLSVVVLHGPRLPILSGSRLVYLGAFAAPK